MDGELSAIFRKRVPEAHWTRIESRLTGSGIPDLCCAMGSTFWIETKKARGNKVVFQPFQVPWLQRHARAGGRCFVAVRRTSKLVDELWLFRGLDAGAVEDRGLDPDLAIGLWSGGPARWDWAAIRKAFAG